MSNFVSVIFCRNCNSRYVEVSEWGAGRKMVFHCRSCGATEEVGKFTLGRCMASNAELANARESAAKGGKYER